MEIKISVSKINKYASPESGDTVEVVERPNGGMSVVMADGQSSGKWARRNSNMVARKVVSPLAEGVRRFADWYVAWREASAPGPSAP